MIYLFDVDGTLTEPRQSISKEMYATFEMFCKENEVYLISGSTVEMIKQQLGNAAYFPKKVFGSQGNEIWENGRMLHSERWVRTDLEELLKDILSYSAWDLRTGNHIVRRPGMYNFSIPGRNANKEVRRMYARWEAEHKERPMFKRIIEHHHIDLDVSIGGQTSIDISPEGKGKDQILKFLPLDQIAFFGDKTMPGGNDFKIASVIKLMGHKVYQVEGPDETHRILRNLQRS